MTTIRDVIPTEYLCADDLAGRDHTVTIRAVDVDAKSWERGKRKRCVALYFEGAQKGLKLNITNHDIIAFKLGYGKTLEGWVGKRITLYPTIDERIRTDDKSCVRVRPTVPKPANGQKPVTPKTEPEPVAEAPAPETEPAQ